MYIRLHIKISYQYRSHFLYIFHLLIPRCAMTQCQKKKQKKTQRLNFQVVPICVLKGTKP